LGNRNPGVVALRIRGKMGDSGKGGFRIAPENTLSGRDSQGSRRHICWGVVQQRRISNTLGGRQSGGRDGGKEKGVGREGKGTFAVSTAFVAFKKENYGPKRVGAGEGGLPADLTGGTWKKKGED